MADYEVKIRVKRIYNQKMKYLLKSLLKSYI